MHTELKRLASLVVLALSWCEPIGAASELSLRAVDCRVARCFVA